MNLENISELLALTDRDFIIEAYNNILGREPDPHGMQFYMDMLANGGDKKNIVIQLGTSKEAHDKHSDQISGLKELVEKYRRSSKWSRLFLFWMGRVKGAPLEQREITNASKSALMSIPVLNDNLLSRDVVRGAFYEILGREPENEDVIFAHRRVASEAELKKILLDSDEYKTKLASETKKIDELVQSDRKTLDNLKSGNFPLISIVIVNFNGAQHIDVLADSINRQRYKNIEVIFMDNNSTDDSVALAKNINNVRIVNADDNYGFAEGNNIAQELVLGDYILLLNNDIQIKDDDFIEKLLGIFYKYKNIVAVSPKIRFYEKFVHIKIKSIHEFELDRDMLISQLGAYKKIFFPSGDGFQPVHEFMFPVSSNHKDINIGIIGNNDINGHVDGNDCAAEYQIYINGRAVDSATKNSVTKGRAQFCVTVSENEGNYIINNVGSYVAINGDAGDIGIGEKDYGQYDFDKEIDAFCGACVLIKRSALGNYPLFSPYFFAYYEDTELSIRMRSGGGAIVYTSSATLYHKHASTSNDKSSQFKYLIARNSLLFKAIHFRHLVSQELKSAKERFNHFRLNNDENTFTEKSMREFISKTPELEDELSGLIPRALNGLIFYRKRKFLSIGIYNKYWSTKGGGELRALHLAQYLSRYGIVDLICDDEFDFDDIKSYFNMPLENVRKSIVKGFSPDDTAGYDVFINTTHHSNLVSYSKFSLYLLSFPHRHASISMLRSYDVFLSNSIFTKSWAQKYWGPAAADVSVLYPAIDKPSFKHAHAQSSEKIILSIGRFFSSGHSKKQIEMVKGFYEAMKLSGNSQWILVIIGSLNVSDKSCVDYYNNVLSEVVDDRVKVISNCTHSEKISYLTRASIYLHAAGLGTEVDNPEAMEHFGMSLVESMSYGCVPIVFNGGGLPEIVGQEFSSKLFSSYEEMVNIISSTTQDIDSSRANFELESKKAIFLSERFSMSFHDEHLEMLMEKNISIIKNSCW